MPALRPYCGDLAFTHGTRTVTVSRRDGLWAVEPNRGARTERETVVAHVIAGLGLSGVALPFVTFTGVAGLVGRIRDGGGPRESYVVDYDAPNELWGMVTDTISSAFAELLEELESEDPPGSGS